MRTRPIERRPTSILVLGEAQAAQARATDLRLHGYGAWVATTEPELRWLSDQAWIRPSLAVVEVPAGPDNRGVRVRHLATLAMRSGLPTVVIGARDDELDLFPQVLASYPHQVDSVTVVEALGGVIDAVA